MDRLSSCYFCGVALDASLSEYPVVPKRLQSGETPDRRVVLCPTCRRKLAAILGDVVAAAEDDPEDQSGLMDESGMEPRPDPMDLSEANETDDAVEGGETDASLLGGSGDESDESAHRDEEAERAQRTAADESDDEPSLTRLEYSKVMRLLQNRQFPVARAEIREVAVNAYDIEPEQFDAVIDAAVDRGLIDEENGQFVAAE